MILETERLILREWELKDIDALVEGLNNIEVSKWLAGVPHPYTKEIAQSFISKAKEQSAENSRKDYSFAIVLKTEDKVIGGLSLGKINFFNGTADGGIWLNAKYGRHGYGVEAFGRRNDFAFETLGLRRMNNGFFEGNECSKKMQLKLGYTIEGKKRHSHICKADGIIKDEVMTGLLKEDWLNLKNGG